MTLAAMAAFTEEMKRRESSFSPQPSVLTDIYKEEIHLAVWTNPLSEETIRNVDELLNQVSHLKAVMTLTPNRVVNDLIEHTPEFKDKTALCEHIQLLVDMFCTLFELNRVGLRLNLVSHAMCPKFHVDRVPCRLVTTLSGVATQWLAHNNVDRSKLGVGSIGKPDETSGIMQSADDIAQLSTGDVALLKGEGWYDNENAGLVHRSPVIAKHDRRLILTLDFIE